MVKAKIGLFVVWLRSISRRFGCARLVALLAITAAYCIGPGTGDFSTKLCGNCTYIGLSAYNQYVTCETGNSYYDWPLRIPAQIVEIGWGSRYIVASQRTLDERGRPNVAKLYFWIIDSKKGSIFGPMNHMQFGRKRVELGVPSRIRLRKRTPPVNTGCGC